MPTSNEDRNIHLPDIMFCKYCEDQFGINRGVYNSIDSWFFNQGINNIFKRRKNILNFLQAVCKSDSDNGLDKFKFGKGGLNIQLNHYFQTICSANPIRDAFKLD
jgi:riboflavin kinase